MIYPEAIAEFIREDVMFPFETWRHSALREEACFVSFPVRNGRMPTLVTVTGLDDDGALCEWEVEYTADPALLGKAVPLMGARLVVPPDDERRYPDWGGLTGSDIRHDHSLLGGVFLLLGVMGLLRWWRSWPLSRL